MGYDDFGSKPKICDMIIQNLLFCHGIHEIFLTLPLTFLFFFFCMNPIGFKSIKNSSLPFAMIVIFKMKITPL